MNRIPRRTLVTFSLVAAMTRARQFPENQPEPHRMPGDRDPDQKLPDGKSQKDAIARADHRKALEEAAELVRLAQQLQDDLTKAGDFVVPMSSVKRTEEIEKLSRRIRGRLRG